MCTSVSQVCLVKACKNKAEVAAMYSANQKAAVALAKYFAWLEVNYQDYDEVTSSDKLQELYSAGKDYKYLSCVGL